MKAGKFRCYGKLANARRAVSDVYRAELIVNFQLSAVKRELDRDFLAWAKQVMEPQRVASK